MPVRRNSYTSGDAPALSYKRPPMTAKPADQSFFFFFNDTATTEIYTLLHDALPIYQTPVPNAPYRTATVRERGLLFHSIGAQLDRKSTRLNSSHLVISYAVFCL